MAWFDLIGSWAASVQFGVAAILALLGVECLMLARRSYMNTRNELEEDAMLGAEFGVFSAPSARLQSAPAVPKQCYLLAAGGAAALFTSVACLSYTFL